MMHSIRCQHGSTALHFAASNGHAEVTKLLLYGGADVKSIYRVSDMTREVVVIV